MLTGKGVKYAEKGREGFGNYYAINFMPSGAGKDLMSDELDKFVYYPDSFQKKINKDNERNM